MKSENTARFWNARKEEMHHLVLLRLVIRQSHLPAPASSRMNNRVELTQNICKLVEIKPLIMIFCDLLFDWLFFSLPFTDFLMRLSCSSYRLTQSVRRHLNLVNFWPGNGYAELISTLPLGQNAENESRNSALHIVLDERRLSTEPGCLLHLEWRPNESAKIRTDDDE